MQVIVYTFEDAEGNEFGTFQTQDQREAEQYARDNSLRCIANTFVYDDRETAWDFTDARHESEDDIDDEDIDEDEDGNPASEDSIEDEYREP